MKSYKEIADKVFERRDKYLVAKKLKKKKIIKRTSAALCALVVVLGLGVWHLGWFGVNPPISYSHSDLNYDHSGGLLDEQEIPITTTTTKQYTTTATTTRAVTTQSQKTTSSTELKIEFSWTPITMGPIGTTKGPGTNWYDYTRGYALELEYGRPIDWLTEGDVVHIAFGKSRYVRIDASTRKVIKDVVLPSSPSKMKIVGDEIWISYTSLKKIVVYDKGDLSVKREITLNHEVGRFDVCADYLVYTVGEQHMRVYRYNLATQTLDVITPSDIPNFPNGYMFGAGEVMINQQENLLYVGEKGSTDDALFCYDLQTLEIKSYYRTDAKWADINKYRQMYLCDGKLYWSKFCMDATDVSKVESTYSGYNNRSGMVYVDERVVINIVGIYQRNGKQLRYLNLQSATKGAIITQSGHLVVIESGRVYIVKNLLK